jgi:hypothetical protein
MRTDTMPVQGMREVDGALNVGGRQVERDARSVLLLKDPELGEADVYICIPEKPRNLGRISATHGVHDEEVKAHAQGQRNFFDL